LERKSDGTEIRLLINLGRENYSANPIYSGDLNYLVDAPFKDEIQTYKTGTVTMKKLFRKAEFIDFYEKGY
jgi:hypothetical protein